MNLTTISKVLKAKFSLIPNSYLYLLAATLFFVDYLLPSLNKSWIATPYPTNVDAGIGLPRPLNYSSANLLPAITNRLFGVTNSFPPSFLYVFFLFVLHAAIYLLFLSIFIKWGGTDSRGFLILVLTFLPMHSLLLKSLEVYDVYIYLGIVLCFYSFFSNQNFFLLGAGIFVLAHPEQSLASFSALLILTFTNKFYFLRIRVIRALAISIIVNVAIQIWYAVYGFRGSRTVEIIFSFPNTLNEHAADLLGSLEIILRMYGLYWILVLYVIVTYPLNAVEKFIYIVSLVLAPAFFWFITSDGLRCVVPMTTLLTLVLVTSLVATKNSTSR